MKNIFEKIEKHIETMKLDSRVSNTASKILELELSNIKAKLSSWTETHHEIVKVIGIELNKDESTSKVINDRYAEQGTGGMYELAEELTDEFEELHKDTVWDGEFFDTIDKFIKEKLFAE